MDPLVDLLTTGATKMDLCLSEQQAQDLITYLRVLHKWNSVHHFSGIHTLEAMVFRHLLDSLSAVPWITGKRIADVGTGPGLPGLPLALYFPLKQFVLIEVNAKRVSFLRHIVAHLRLANVEILHGRVPKVALATPVDQVVARAFSALGNFLEQTAYLLRPGGTWLAFKGRHFSAELNLPPEFSCQVIKVSLPNELDRESNLLLVQRHSIMPSINPCS